MVVNGRGLFSDRLVEIWAEPGRAGTGVAVGGRGIVTARHVVEGALTSRDGILVRIVPTGAVEAAKPVWVRADCVSNEPDWDMAVLEVRDDPEWVVPHTLTPVMVALDSRPEPDCHSVGFPAVDAQISSAGKPLRQTTSVIGRLLPAGQARRPGMSGRKLPERWRAVGHRYCTPAETGPMERNVGRPGCTPDGRLAAIVVEASVQTRPALRHCTE